MAERRKKVIKIALVIFMIGATYAVVTLLLGAGIPCPFHALTGLLCPGCGVSRMFLSLFRLDFASALRYNAAVLCLLPLMAATAARYSYVYVKYGTRRDKFADTAVWVMIALLLAFGVIRNIL